MTKAKLATTITTALILMLLASPAYAATVTVTTNKTVYGIGEALIVSGTASPVTAGQDVSIQVFDPAGARKALAQVTPAADGTYSTTVMVFASGDPAGTWSVKATYMGVSNTATFALTGVPAKTIIVLDVSMDVGSIYFRGETAEFYVLTSYQGAPIEANISASLYAPGPVTGVTIVSTRIAVGLYKTTCSIPADAPTGTYALVVSAATLTAQYEGKGTALKAFLLSPTLTGWNAWLIEIKDGVATIKTDVGTIKVDVAAINATLVTIEDDVATIKTDLGTVKVDVAAIKATVTDIKDGVATIKTDVGTIKTDVAAIKPVITKIDGNVVTIVTDVGTIKGTVTAINTDVATIKTDVGTIKTNVASTLTAATDAKTAATGAKSAVDAMSTPLYAAVVLALVAAIAAIVSVIQMSRKIAG